MRTGTPRASRPVGDATAGLAGAAGDEGGKGLGVWVMGRVNDGSDPRSIAVRRESIRQRLRLLSTLLPVDTLARLLDAPRAREAFLLEMVMARPWAVRVRTRPC